MKCNEYRKKYSSFDHKLGDRFDHKFQLVFGYRIARWILLVFTFFHLGFAGGKVELNVVPLSDLGEQESNGKPSVCIGNNTLPSMKSRGLVFFLHIPKTGGTTIRLKLQETEGVKYMFAKNYSTYYDSAPLVENFLLNTTRSENESILFFEVHATTAPSFYKLRNRLKRWRDTANHNRVPVFFFTVLRESISYAFSHFNFFHLQKRNPSFERCNATEHDFLRKSVFNPQCQFLFKGEPSMRGQKRIQTESEPKKRMVHMEDCDDVEETLFELMDWVGTTERLSTETIPLLSKVLNKASTGWENHRVSKTMKGYIAFGKENISSIAMESIHSMSRYDMKLYRNAKNRYQYKEMMS